MTPSQSRERTLYGLQRARGSPHRYTLWRWSIGVVFTSLVLALPLSGSFHFDLWRGQHTVGGREVDFATAAKYFAFPFLGLNIAILLATRFLGRYLCGFVCPYGNIARLLEWARTRRRRRIVARLACAVVCALLAYAVLAFWVDVRVLIDGDAAWRCGASAFLLVASASLYGFAQRVGLRFCQRWCPTGVYFAVLAHDGRTGIELAHPETCTDCGVCDRVCPIDLQPRAFASSRPSPQRGWYGDSFTNAALCIRCGDCVAACENTRMPALRGDRPPPLRLGFLTRADAVAVRAADPTAAAADSESSQLPCTRVARPVDAQPSERRACS